jgi:DNA (cytosine-5)-methyltransferase 1
VGENVLGLVNWNGGLVFNEVQADLEAEGYTVQPYVLPACAVNAPHRRDRVWFVAHSAGARNGNNGRGRNLCEGNKLFQESKWEKNKQWDKSLSQSGHAPNAKRNGQHGCNGEHKIEPSQRGVDAQRDVEPIRGNDSHTHSAGLQKTRSKQQATRTKQYGELHGGAIGWADFPTESPVCGVNDGISTGLDGIAFSKWRNESVKAYGNAIVPQVAHQMFKAIHQYECQASPNP